jgi:hypothetical protein
VLLLALLAALQIAPSQAPPLQTPPPPPPPAAAPAPSPCQDPVVALRCPDLVMAPPRKLRAERLPSGRIVLRMENRIVNIGAGAVELFGRRSGPREMVAAQVIADGAGARRRFPTTAELYYTSVPTRGGDYWKLDDAARFELWSLAPDGTRTGLVRLGPKLRYCLRDLDRVRSWPRVPRRRVFPACNQSHRKREVTVGTSVGWADVYPRDYPGNYIEVTGLIGCFAVLHRVDPERHIFESSEANNVAGRTIRLPYRPGRQNCAPYVR